MAKTKKAAKLAKTHLARETPAAIPPDNGITCPEPLT
jgi:hypothetical protein